MARAAGRCRRLCVRLLRGLELDRPDALGLANYLCGAAQVSASVVVLLSCEMARRAPLVEGPALVLCQALTASTALGGVILQAAFIGAASRVSAEGVPGVQRILDRTIWEAKMMMFMFAAVSATDFTMAFGVQLVHEFPLATSLGGQRSVYSIRYAEWMICTPLLTLSGHNGGRTADDQEIKGGLQASAFNLGASCFCAWVGSVTTSLPIAAILIVFAWIGYFLTAWQHLLFAWRIRHAKTTGMTKAKMLCIYMIINAAYGIVFTLALFGIITPMEEQLFWVLGDLTSKYTWAAGLTMVRHNEDQVITDILRAAAWKEGVRLERMDAADEAKQELQLAKKVAEAVAAVEELTHPMVLVPAAAFLEHVTVPRIPCLQESFKAEGVLKVLDSMEEVRAFKAAGARIIFFSYECLQFNRVAPNEVQLAAMKASVVEAAAIKDTKLDHFYVWLDCFSVPQKNAFLKKAAINTLYSFASIPDMLVMVCPESRHASTMMPANMETIKTRFWCRLEQLAFFCSQGSEGMMLHLGAKLEPMPADWMDAVCCVYEANTTCCRLQHSTIPTCDREGAVLPLLALYYDVYRRVICTKELSLDCAVWQLICRSKENMFPKQYVFNHEGKEEMRDLFGDMIERLESLLEKQWQGGCVLSVKTCISQVSSNGSLLEEDNVVRSI